ncbi:MAG: DUF362 domain-containing protein [Methanobacterium sp.]|uniref:DUF362 domain-containing protein n=1 Tax=Methanobacterium sp. TaxID=2164 RepID=UPI003D64D9C4|nr:DUF362 domain-containing protein [Methanobacterium sp.]
MNDYYAYISKITDLKEDIEKSLKFIKWKKYVKKDSTVFIKPNFTFPYYKEGITTSPILIEYFLEILKDRAENVILGESDGGNDSFKAEDAFKGHDMYRICRDNGVELLNLSKEPSKFVEENINGKKVKVELPKLLLDDVNCFISLPVLKVHVMTNVTLSIKNLWGCHPNSMRCLHHKNLSEKLTLITKCLDPKIILMDGIYALDGHGPMYGEAKKVDLILSSNNSVAIDSLGANVMGMPVKDVEHILTAEKEGLGTTNLEDIQINTNWNEFQMQFDLNKTFIDMLNVPLFKSETLAKLAYDSSITPLIYKFVRFLRNSEEQNVADEMKRYNK